MKERLEQAYKKAKECMSHSQIKQKRFYDVKVRGATIAQGDRVRVKITSFDGRHKLQDKWSAHPYTVMRQPNEGTPVFEVQRVDGKGNVCTLHRNHRLFK